MSRIASFASAFAYSGFAVGESAADVTIADAVVTEVTVGDEAIMEVTVADEEANP